MAFLAPIGAALVGGLIGKSGQKKQQDQQAQLQAQQLALLQQQQQRANQLFDQYAAPNLTDARGLFTMLSGLYKSLLSNSPEGMGLQNQLLGPTRDARARSSQMQMGQISSLMPRGGSQAGLFANNLFQRHGDDNRDLLGLKGMALDKLEGIGQGFGLLGGQATGASNQLSGSAAGGMGQLNSQLLAQKESEANRSAGIWGNVGNIGGRLLGDWLSRRKSGGSSSNSPMPGDYGNW